MKRLKSYWNLEDSPWIYPTFAAAKSDIMENYNPNDFKGPGKNAFLFHNVNGKPISFVEVSTDEKGNWNFSRVRKLY